MNGTIIDGTGADPIPDGLVAIGGNRIVAVGPAADFTVPQDVVIIDAAGGTILPGIFNAHAHKTATAATRRHLFLLNGVTSVCDLGDLLARMGDFEEQEIQSGPAARGFNAGPMVTAPAGYPGPYYGYEASYEVQDEAEAELAVRDLHARGADFIKVALEPGLASQPLPVIGAQELSTLVATAHAEGLLVRAHVTNSAMLDLALDAGVDVIEHVPLPYDAEDNLAPLFDAEGNFRPPSELESQLLRLIDQGVVLVPTLDVLTSEAVLRGELGAEPEVFIQALVGVVDFYHDSGGIVAVGNDYGNPGVQHGLPLREMDLLRSAGLSPLEVIEAATRHAAYVCGHGDELGTLEVGKLADLIVVDGNPLDDLEALSVVSYVLKDGQFAVSPQQENE
jgi:imidazolonepropionase-like amidohydrolase